MRFACLNHSQRYHRMGVILALCLFLCFVHSPAQDGYFSYEIDVQGTGRLYHRTCDGYLIFNTRYPIQFRRPGTSHSWFTALSGGVSEHWEDSRVTFHIFWHGIQPPTDPFVALVYNERARLRAHTPPWGGHVTTTFTGNLFSKSISLSGCADPHGVGCDRSVSAEASDIHPYSLTFTQVNESLWRGEIQVPFRVQAQIRPGCASPPLASPSGDVEAYSSVSIGAPKFVYMTASNEPSYHKAGPCVAEVNNLSGRLDQRFGDTVVSLHPVYGAYEGVSWTDWYVGNKLDYVRQLYGNWCPGDCPLNEWWICGSYYKDNLFHDFRMVNAIIGLPDSDCENWFLGTEPRLNNEPSESFWEERDVQERLAKILGQLPFKYEVKLKVTDDEGDGFSDQAHYTMTVHAPLEDYQLLSTRFVYLPERVNDQMRPGGPTNFIRSPMWGATTLAILENHTEVEQETTKTISTADSYTQSTTISGECSASGAGSIIHDKLAKVQLAAKFGASRTVSTTSTYQIGTQIQLRVPPKTRLFFCAQRVGDIEEGVWDVYGWNGYQGTMNSTDIRRTADGFAFVWDSERLSGR